MWSAVSSFPCRFPGASVVAALGMVCLSLSMPARSGELPAVPTGPVLAAAPGPDAASFRQPEQPDAFAEPALTEAQVRLRTWGIIGGGAAAIVAYGMNNWWQDGFTGQFRTANEGWFGQNTNDGGADKLGHMYGNYVGTRLLARGLEWAGNSRDTALWLAGLSTFGAYTAIEVADAYTEKWKFSYEDVVMNALGVGLAVAMEKNPDLDRLVDFRLLYRPSDEPRSNYFDPFGDYSGQTYLMILKASGVERFRHDPVMRYFEFAVGYGTRGYGAPPDMPSEPSRNVYVGISVNLSELLGQTVFASSTRRGRTQRFVDGFLEFVQIPGTVALTHKQL
jgi:hypothetical protein